MPKIITERIIDRPYSMSGITETQIQALIDTAVTNALDAYVPPASTPITLDTLIRASIGPIKGTSDTFTFTIPDNVVTGDVMIVAVSNRTHQTPEATPFLMGVDTHGGWTEYTTSADTTEIGVTHAIRRVGCEEYTRIAGAMEAGTDYTFDFVAAPETYYWYFIALNGTYIDDVNNAEIGFNGLDGYGDPSQSNFYVDSTTVVNANSFLFVAGAIDGNVRTTPPANWRELGDVGDSNASIFIMAKLANAGASGVIQAFMDDSAAYFASVSLECQGVV